MRECQAVHEPVALLFGVDATRRGRQPGFQALTPLAGSMPRIGRGVVPGRAQRPSYHLVVELGIVAQQQRIASMGARQPRTAVPIPAILMFMVLGVLATLFNDSIQQLVLAAAVLPAVIYLVTVIAYLLRRNRLSSQFGTFTLGRFGTPIACAAACWLVAMIAVLSIPESFRGPSLISLGLCAAGLVPWFCWFRGRIDPPDAGPDIKS